MTDGPVALAQAFVAMEKAGPARVHGYGDGDPPAIDGYTVGVAHMSEPPPHGGERHVDGDELLYLVSGRISVLLEEPAGERVVDVSPGEAFIVPQGLWHRLLVHEPCHLVFITPGPTNEHRPSR